MQISRISGGNRNQAIKTIVDPLRKSRPFSHRQQQKSQPATHDNKNSRKYVGRESSSKTPSKHKHPIIRSYIIKEPQQQNMEEMVFDCDKHHNNFINMLSQCINKRSLNLGTKKRVLGTQAKNLQSQSFNNLRVKESLKLGSFSGLNLIPSPKGRDLSKNNNQRLRRSIKLSKNKNMMQNDTKQKQSRQKQQIIFDYTHITQYNFNTNTNQNERSLNGSSNFEVSGSNLFTSDFSPSKNYTSYLWNFKQRKLKKKTKGSPDGQLRSKVSFSNSQILNLTSKMESKQSGSRLMNRNNCFMSQNQPKVCHTTLSPTKNDNADIKLEDLQVFSHIRAHTPRKRKISTNTYSQSPTKAQQGQNSQIALGPAEFEDGEEGNSCYLQTINF